MKKQIDFRIVSLVFSVLVICFAIAFYVVAWDEPQQAPSGCTSGQPGCDAPINVSNTPQIKSGSLRLGGLSVDNDTWLATSAGNVGIGTTSPGAKLHVAGGQIRIDDNDVPLVFRENDRTGAGSLWRLVLDYNNMRFDSSDNGVDFSPYTNPIIMKNDGYVYGHWGNVISSPSDIRLKKDVATIPNALDKVLALRGVNFRWKDSDSDDGRLHMGLIAQEVEKVVPEIVGTADDEMETKGVGYQRMVALLVEAIKEQQKEIDSLKEEITELKVQLNIGQ